MVGDMMRFFIRRSTTFRQTGTWLGITALGLGLSGCAVTDPPVLPALAGDATGQIQPGRMVWYDCYCADAETARTFYGDLFGWSFDTSETYGNFSLALLEGRPVAGLIEIDPEKAETINPQWVPNLLVQDLDWTVAAFRRDGSVLRGPVDVPDRGRLAVVEDAEGAPLLLLEVKGGSPPDADGAHGSFLWTELWTADETVSLPFYGYTVGYEPVEGPPGLDPDYVILGLDGNRQVGVVEIPFEGVKPHWLSYIAVEDPVQTAARAVALGGRVLVSPEDTNGRMAAIIEDPAGSIFGVQRWPLEETKEDSR